MDYVIRVHDIIKRMFDMLIDGKGRLECQNFATFDSSEDIATDAEDCGSYFIFSIISSVFVPKQFDAALRENPVIGCQIMTVYFMAKKLQ